MRLPFTCVVSLECRHGGSVIFVADAGRGSSALCAVSRARLISDWLGRGHFSETALAPALMKQTEATRMLIGGALLTQEGFWWLM